MLLVDHFFVLLLFVVLPIHGAQSFRYYLKEIEAGNPVDRVSIYRLNMIMQWIALAVLMVFWLLLDRPLSSLGLVFTASTGLYIGAAILLLGIVFLLLSWHKVKAMDDKDKSKQAQGLGKIIHFLPHNNRELRAFTGLSFTAGVVEEIIYRGFVLWYLGLVMPLWVAVVLSSVLFGLGHSYQGLNGAIKTGLAGLAFAGLYLLTGSIWLPILGHVLFDAIQGLMIAEILRTKSKKA